jgi:predicted alpha/beta superfamily hydrolase
MKKQLVFVLFCLAAGVGNAQESTPFPFGEVRTMMSQVLNEKRILNIYLPVGYQPDSSVYPVVYVLDGSAHEDYPHIAGLVQFMNMYDMMPKSIVVGIANVDRYRDFTHKSSNQEDLESLPTSGGSLAFINFISDELQPFMDAEYATSGKNTIIGQSLGGLLAAELLMTRPYLFNNYIIVSPSLWWDSQALLKQAPQFFKTQKYLEKGIYVSIGKEHPVMHEVTDAFVAAIGQAENPKLHLFYEPFLDEDHATILHMAVYNAFKQLNSGIP